MVVSYDLLHELESVLLRDNFRRKLAISDVIEYVIWLRENAEFVPTPGVVVEISPDPDDDYLIGLALSSEARFLVTGNTAHFQPGTGLGAVVFVTPREFVALLQGVGR